MNFIFLFAIACALALDAFSVSLAAGAYLGKPDMGQKLRLSIAFASFQGIMPFLGWMGGVNLLEYIQNFDHWLAFVLLAGIGGKMIWDGANGEIEKINKDITKGLILFTLSVATSIDAMAIGLSFGVMNDPILIPCILIGIVTFLLSWLGIAIGSKLSIRFGSKSMIFGGVVLIAIGMKIFIEHMTEHGQLQHYF